MCSQEKVRVHQFDRYYLCNFLCEKCLGCKHLPDMSAYDFEPGAAWKTLLFTDAAYKHSRSPKSPWTCVKSWTMFRNRDDLLHMLYLGLAKDVSGQCLFDFAWEGSDCNGPNVCVCLALLIHSWLFWMASRSHDSPPTRPVAHWSYRTLPRIHESMGAGKPWLNGSGDGIHSDWKSMESRTQCAIENKMNGLVVMYLSVSLYIYVYICISIKSAEADREIVGGCGGELSSNHCLLRTFCKDHLEALS